MPLKTLKWYWPLLMLILLLPAGSFAQAKFYNQLDLLEGKKKVTIPFRYIHNFIVVDVRIYGILPLKFIFDTGAEHIILFKREYTDMLGIEYDKRVPIMGSDLSREIYALITRNARVEVQGLEAKPCDLLVMEEDYFNLDEMVGTPIAGLLGGGFFKNLVVNIDYKKGQITLYDPKHFKAPDDFLTLPINIKTNKPYIQAEASLQDGTVVQVDLLVDTGAGVPLLLHTNSHPSLHLPEHYIRGKLGIGLGGYLEGYIGRIQKLTFGTLEFPGVLTSFQDIEETWLLDKDRFRNGILGNQMLNRFNVFFDYNHGQMFLKPYRTTQKPFLMDRSGLIIFAYGQEFRDFVVKDIIENSPAHLADIRTGDIILKIQGYQTKEFTLDIINGWLQKQPGKRIRLVLSRDHQIIRKSFYLKDLI